MTVIVHYGGRWSSASMSGASSGIVLGLSRAVSELQATTGVDAVLLL